MSPPLAGLAALALLAGFAGEAPAPAAASPGPEGVAIDPPAAAGAFAPALAVAGDALLAAWLERGDGGGHRVVVARWRAGGWSAPVTVAAGERIWANWADTPEIAVGGDGSTLVAWLESSGAGRYDYDLWVARSRDGGASFARLGRLNDDGVAAEHGFVSFATTPAGARAFWLDGRATPAGGAMALYTAAIDAAGIGVRAPLDERVCDCCSTAAAAVGGATLVAYRDRSPGEIRDVRLARRAEDGAVATLPVGGEGWQIAGCPVNGPALAAAGEQLTLAWFTAAGEAPRVRFARSADGGRSVTAPVTLDAEAPVGRAAAAALGEGRSAVAWIARAGAGAELRLVLIDGAGAAGPRRAVAALSAGRASGRPRLAALGDRLAVAWTDGERPGETRLRVRLLPVAALPAP